MARPTEDDSLEPILPRHPPTAPPEGAPEVVSAVTVAEAGRRSWDRWLLLACAVVATVALVVCALRLNAIAADQRLEACQVEVYIEESIQNRGRNGFDPGDDRIRERLAGCIGVDPDAEDSGDGTGDGD